MANKDAQKIFKEDIPEIKALYAAGESIADIAKKWGVSYGTMQRFFLRHGIQIRTLKEAKQVSTKTGVGLAEWRKENGSWCKGLTKEDPKMHALIEKGRQTQLQNGKSKGKNNPMYGKVAPFKRGFRQDLSHFTRSSWEANFSRILLHLGIKYVYEPKSFVLFSGQTYTPDFFLPERNKYYEIKGYAFSDKYLRFVKEYPHIRIVVVDEQYYNRLILRFAKRISFEDKLVVYSRDEIKTMFLGYCKDLDKRPSVQDFCQKNKISIKFCRKLFGSDVALKEEVKDEIKQIEVARLVKKYKELERVEVPTKRKFYNYYPRGVSLVNNYFDGSFNNLKEFVSNLKEFVK